MRKILWLIVVLLLATPVWGQITVPNTFVPGTVASASQVNANFEALGISALNRSGGTITGTIAVDPGVTVDGVDISELLHGNTITIGKGVIISTTPPQLVVGYDPAHVLEIGIDQDGNATIGVSAPGAIITFTDPVKFGTITVDAINLGTVNCTGCIGPTQLKDTGVGASAYGNTTNVATFTVDADGRLTAAGNAPIAFPAGAPTYPVGPNQIPETAIIDGDLLARLASNDTIAGAWTFNQAVTMGSTLGTTFTHYTPGFGRTMMSLNSNTNVVQFWPNTEASGVGAILRVGGDVSVGAVSIQIQKLGHNAYFTVGEAIGTTSFSQANGGGLLLEWRQDKSMWHWGNLIPAGDGTLTLGAPDHRYATANFQLPQNQTPALVVVNKGGAGADNLSAMGYAVGFGSPTPITKTFGACQVTIAAGLILNVTGC